jgi:hypothetical protein
MSDQLPAPRQEIARTEPPWRRPGRVGVPCALLFDPSDGSLWVRVGETYHPVRNLLVRHLEVESGPPSGPPPGLAVALGGEPHWVPPGPAPAETRVRLDAMLREEG